MYILSQFYIIRNWSLTGEPEHFLVLIVNGEVPLVGGWLKYGPNGATERGDGVFTTPVSSRSLMTGRRPSVACLSRYWGMFTVLSRGGRVPGVHLESPTRKAKNLSLFHVARCVSVPPRL